MKTLLQIGTAAFVGVLMTLATGCQKDEGAGASATSGDTAQATPYPLKVCIVSGEELGSMGDPVVKVHAGQEIKFCCKDCVSEFESEPAKFLAKLKTDAVIPKLP